MCTYVYAVFVPIKERAAKLQSADADDCAQKETERQVAQQTKTVQKIEMQKNNRDQMMSETTLFYLFVLFVPLQSMD